MTGGKRKWDFQDGLGLSLLMLPYNVDKIQNVDQIPNVDRIANVDKIPNVDRIPNVDKIPK